MILFTFLFLSLISFSPLDSIDLKDRQEVTRNWIGPLGAWIAHYLHGFFGFGSFLFTLIVLVWGIGRIRLSRIDSLLRWTLGLAIVSLSLMILAGLFTFLPDEARTDWGGLAGVVLATVLISYVGRVGSYLTVLALLVLTVFLSGRGESLFKGLWGWMVELWRRLTIFGAAALKKLKSIRIERKPRPKMKRKPEPSAVPPLKTFKSEGADEPEPPDEQYAPPLIMPEPEEDEEPAAPEVPGAEPLSVGEEKRIERVKPDFAAATEQYKPPSLDLLTLPEERDQRVTREEMELNAAILIGKLKDFAIDARVSQVNPGPVVTSYEIEPAPGVKLSRIASLQNDLALAMKAKRVRIVAPIPGKGVVGIEIPNAHPRIVYLREVMESKEFTRSASPLPLALGVDTAGSPYTCDLTAMPHLLVAGTTGSGKSVCINAMITNLLYRAAPDRLRFIMVDPKRLELSAYNGIPHLLADVVTDPAQAVQVLKMMVEEMESRYRLLARHGARNIQDFNRRVDSGQLTVPMDEEGEGEAEVRRLPFIVIIIDELADLMMTTAREIEDLIARLAQMARAVGIHMILATQRPSVDVLTGVIKANFPTRIAFQVSSKTDSRTILDMNGAETLLGSGDMLFIPTWQPEPLRLHGAFISTSETESIVKFLRKQPGPGDTLDLDGPETGGWTPAAAGRDELFDEALGLVVRHQQGSISLLQRRLKVGYSRAARLIDELEAAGIVGSFDGSKAREVLVDESYLDDLPENGPRFQ